MMVENRVLVSPAQEEQNQPKNEPAKDNQEGILAVALFIKEDKSFRMAQTFIGLLAAVYFRLRCI